jgi:hypothetical protein
MATHNISVFQLLTPFLSYRRREYFTAYFPVRAYIPAFQCLRVVGRGAPPGPGINFRPLAETTNVYRGTLHFGVTKRTHIGLRPVQATLHILAAVSVFTQQATENWFCTTMCHVAKLY